jgi:HIRAN domain
MGADAVAGDAAGGVGGVAKGESPVSLDHFFGQVAGESYRNADGSDRQAIIPHCRVGELLVLEHEPDNPHDVNAIRVLRETGEQIGYLEREFAGQVVSRSAKGQNFHAVIAGIGRPRRSVPYGVALLIIVENGSASDAEVVAYAREVLSQDRQVEAAGSEVRNTATLNWFALSFVVAVVLIIIALVAAW